MPVKFLLVASYVMLGAEMVTSAAVLSTGVEILGGGVPTNEGGHQYTIRGEKRPAAAFLGASLGLGWADSAGTETEGERK